MTDPSSKLAVVLWAGALAAANPAAQDVAPPQSVSEAAPTVERSPVDQWLDEVRAQREAWETRRRAAKEALDARRRWIDPWGAAQKEAREKEHQRRREAFREQIERDRESLYGQAPWAAQPPQWQEQSPGAPPEPGTAPSDASPPAEGEPTPYPPLPGWDNRWYYRGF
jgi:hypothetical protein